MILTNIQKLKIGLNYLHRAYDFIYDVSEDCSNYDYDAEELEHSLSNLIVATERLIEKMEKSDD